MFLKMPPNVIVERKNAEGSDNDSQEADSWVSKHIHWKDKEEYNTYN